MKSLDLHRVLKELARYQVWCVPEGTLRVMLPRETESAFKYGLSHNVKNGTLTRLGPKLYFNPYSRRSTYAMEHLASYLRPDEFFYLSLEWALHEYGVISQIPTVLTLMTEGHSYTYKTPFGLIEFVHKNNRSKKGVEGWIHRAKIDPVRKIRVADIDLALEDLHEVDRCLDLVDMEAYEDEIYAQRAG